MVGKKDSVVSKGRKFKQVLEGARKVFLREGYSGASVDDIAGEAKVSKATLYSYFPDKELMFSEVFRAELVADVDEPVSVLAADRPAVEAVPLIVRTLATQMVSGAGVRAYRMRVAKSGRFPDLAKEYLDAVYRRQRRDIRAYLERWVQRGELEISDFEIASEQLVALASALVRDRAVFLGVESVSDAQMHRATTAAAQVFLAAYGVRYGNASRMAGEAAMRRADRAKTVPPME